MLKSNKYFNRSSNNEHEIDRQTNGLDAKHDTLYHKHCKGKITCVAQPTNNSNALSRRETEILKRIKSLEEWRFEMMKM